jgi:two-component system, chemotaxis family, sensor kinase CheA
VSMDMTQFYQVFFEEAAELLAEKERLLLGLDIDAPDPEHLNAIFRAAHSIKGGAGTFGFKDMTETTHILETLLDRVRKNELKLTGVMVDALLKAGDVVKAQLAGHKGEGEADPAEAAAVCDLLKKLAAGEAVDAAPATVAVPKPAAAPATIPSAVPTVSVAPPTAAPTGQRYRIEFSLDGSEKANRAVLENMRADLRGRGTLELLSEPAKEDETPARFVWRATTASPEEDVWEALAFLVDPARLKIEHEADAPAAVKSEAQEDPSFGFFEPLYKALVEPSAPADEQSKPAMPASAPATPVAVPVQAAVSNQNAESTRGPGRRAADQPDLHEVKIGRRDNDKVAVTTAEASSIRVSVEKVDQLINLAGELVITQAMLAQTASKMDPVMNEALLKGMGLLERNTRDLQEAVMSIRMMPISFVFSRFPRLVRDLAGKLGKEVELKMVGEGTELDKGLIEKISDPLTHLVRNSIDHGVETPEKRQAAGKGPKGTITLRAFHQGGNIVIEVADDGAGLNREKILQKARSRGMAAPDTMSDQEVWALIFEAGFSTAEVVTDVSGRGVGMDVVRRNIQGMGGSVEIDSALGMGTRMSIRLPLTLAILDGMSVAVGDETFIIPLAYIVESLQPKPGDLQSVKNQDMVIHVRGEYLPVVSAHDVFKVAPRSADNSVGIYVILEAEGIKKALVVDELLGQHQVVIKSLESNYRKVHGISGATIMGDGRVALILDAGELVRGRKPGLRVAA